MSVGYRKCIHGTYQEIYTVVDVYAANILWDDTKISYVSNAVIVAPPGVRFPTVDSIYAHSGLTILPPCSFQIYSKLLTTALLI